MQPRAAAAADIIFALCLSHHHQKYQLSNVGPSSRSSQISEGHLGHLHKSIPPKVVGRYKPSVIG